MLDANGKILSLRRLRYWKLALEKQMYAVKLL